MQVTRGSFGNDLPAAVKTVRIVFLAGAGRSCCIAVDPTRLPIDPNTGRGFLVLDQLPSGAATIALAGFATNFAPTQGGVTAICPTDPAGSGGACDASRLATPSFQSDPQPVTILDGAETNAGDIEVYAVPFLLRANPAADNVATNPVSITFTVVDAATGIDRQSIALGVTQDGSPVSGGPISASPCNDATATPCSAGGALGLSGFDVAVSPHTFNFGFVEARITARNLASPPRGLDFSYQFEVKSVPAGITPTGAAGLTPTPAPKVVIVRPGASIAKAAQRVPAGSTLIVAPGVYGPVVLEAGDLAGPITLIADYTGALSQSAPAPVVINARGQSPAIELADQSDVTIDGFTLRNGDGAGVLLRRSPNTTVRNCTVAGIRGEAVRVESADGALIFDNLIFDNTGAGIRVIGTDDARIINNTVYRNLAAGIAVEDAGNVTLRNNIISRNTPTGIVVSASTTGYDGDYDLNNDGYDGVSAGANDITGSVLEANPLFVFPSGGDFHLQRGIAGSTSPAFDVGDPTTDAELLAVLTQRSTEKDGALDRLPVDLGYHYPGPTPPPTPTPLP